MLKKDKEELKLSKKISGRVKYSKACRAWYIIRIGLCPLLWKNGTQHTGTGYNEVKSILISPGWYRTRKEAREVLKRYKESQR